jgi:hypothetical protein
MTPPRKKVIKAKGLRIYPVQPTPKYANEKRSGNASPGVFREKKGNLKIITRQKILLLYVACC